MRLGNYIKGRGIDAEINFIVWGSASITNKDTGVTSIFYHYNHYTNTLPSFHNKRMLLHFNENLYKYEQYSKHESATFALSISLKRRFDNYDIIIDNFFRDTYVEYVVKKTTTNNKIVFIIAFKKSFEELLKANNGATYDMDLTLQTNTFSKLLKFTLK